MLSVVIHRRTSYSWPSVSASCCHYCVTKKYSSSMIHNRDFMYWEYNAIKAQSGLLGFVCFFLLCEEDQNIKFFFFLGVAIPALILHLGSLRFIYWLVLNRVHSWPSVVEESWTHQHTAQPAWSHHSVDHCRALHEVKVLHIHIELPG